MFVIPPGLGDYWLQLPARTAVTPTTQGDRLLHLLDAPGNNFVMLPSITSAHSMFPLRRMHMPKAGTRVYIFWQKRNNLPY